MNHHKAECVGLYGYGNGKEEREFCSECPKSSECWRVTKEAVETQTTPENFTSYRRMVKRYSKKYPNQKRKATRLAIVALAKNGEIDPYMERVVKNTRKGFEEANRDTPQVVRQFSGGIWLYAGAILVNLK